MTIKTIRPEELEIAKRYGTLGVWWGNHCLATADTDEEAEQARRAFELVLAPRFTRDEAIALCKARLEPGVHRTAHREGVRLALEALAAAGVFVDGRNMADKLDAAGIR